MLKLYPTGFDLGNGLSKFCLDNKASKIPNWATEDEPKGPITKTGIAAKAQVIGIETENHGVLWYGQDCLSLPGFQEIDADKYSKAYIRQMLKAIIARWLWQHKVEPKWLADKRLNIVCGMPPEQWQDKTARNRANKAFSAALNDKKPQYIKVPNKPAFPFFTAFGGLKAETLAWRETKELKNGFTLIADLGFGTSDLVLYDSKKDTPVKTKSLANGLLHSHNEANPAYPWLAELDTLRRINKPLVYANVTKAKIRAVARQLNLAHLVVFGGGAHLLSKQDIGDMKKYAPNFTIGDEFTNVRAFAELAK